MGLARRGSTAAIEAVTANPVRRLLAAFLVGYKGHTRRPTPGTWPNG